MMVEKDDDSFAIYGMVMREMTPRLWLDSERVCVYVKRKDSDACSNNNTAVRNVISFYCYADNITENKSLKSGNGNVTSCASHITLLLSYEHIEIACGWWW